MERRSFLSAFSAVLGAGCSSIGTAPTKKDGSSLSRTLTTSPHAESTQATPTCIEPRRLMPDIQIENHFTREKIIRVAMKRKGPDGTSTVYAETYRIGPNSTKMTEEVFANEPVPNQVEYVAQLDLKGEQPEVKSRDVTSVVHSPLEYGLVVNLSDDSQGPIQALIQHKDLKANWC